MLPLLINPVSIETQQLAPIANTIIKNADGSR
jgi:hypothetical protein